MRKNFIITAVMALSVFAAASEGSAFGGAFSSPRTPHTQLAPQLISLNDSFQVASVYWLPDYQSGYTKSENPDNTIPDGDKNNSKYKCSTYGLLSSCPSGQVGTAVHPHGELICYKNCKVPCGATVGIGSGEQCSEYCQGNCVKKVCKADVGLDANTETCLERCASNSSVCTKKQCKPSVSYDANTEVCSAKCKSNSSVCVAKACKPKVSVDMASERCLAYCASDKSVCVSKGCMTSVTVNSGEQCVLYCKSSSSTCVTKSCAAGAVNLDSRVKPENDRRKKVPENDNTFVKGCHGWKRRGGAAAVAAISALFCLGASEALAQCAVPPTCESLGYNKTITDCGSTETLKCPFDTSKVFCNSNSALNAHIGDIYYSDGTISNSIIHSKTPIGIIAYVNGKGGFAISLEEENLSWGPKINLDCLPNFEIQDDFNGAQNTKCILLQTGTNTYPAAEYCHNYKAAASGTGSKGWYLPAAGEIRALSDNSEEIDRAISKLFKRNLLNQYYWSSSGYSRFGYGYDEYAWSANIKGGYGTGTSKYNLLPVRCVLAF